MPTEDFIHQAPPSTKIWRYISYEKFVSLLDTKALFFCQAKRFDDPFEGSVKLLDMGIGAGTSLEQELELLYDAPNGWRSYTAVNCWHMNEYESGAMWQLYTNKKGVVVQSTVDRLNRSFTNIISFGSVRYGAVTYAKLEDVHPGQNYSIEVVFFRKRPQYDYEREYRVIILAHNWRALNISGGLFVPVNLETLVEAIYVSPSEPSWTREIIDNVIQKRFSLKVPVFSSALSDAPNY